MASLPCHQDQRNTSQLFISNALSSNKVSAASANRPQPQQASDRPGRLRAIFQKSWGGLVTDCEQWDFIVEQRRRRHLDLYLKPKERIALNRKYVGVVFQPFHLLDDMKVEENLEEPLPFRDIKGAERNTMVAGTLDRFNMVGK